MIVDVYRAVWVYVAIYIARRKRVLVEVQAKAIEEILSSNWSVEKDF